MSLCSYSNYLFPCVFIDNRNAYWWYKDYKGYWIRAYEWRSFCRPIIYLSRGWFHFGRWEAHNHHIFNTPKFLISLKVSESLISGQRFQCWASVVFILFYGYQEVHTLNVMCSLTLLYWFIVNLTILVKFISHCQSSKSNWFRLSKLYGEFLGIVVSGGEGNVRISESYALTSLLSNLGNAVISSQLSELNNLEG